jgi:hypothetical protein
MRLVITPQPTADEAAAIETALAMLAAQRITTTRRLRYGNVGHAEDIAMTWIDVARREALGDV